MSEEVIEISPSYNIFEREDSSVSPKRSLQVEGKHPKEIIRYAKYIGIDPEKNSHLMSLAYDGYYSPLPPFWVQKKVNESGKNVMMYKNIETGESLFRHPLDYYYKNRARIELEKCSIDERMKTTVIENISDEKKSSKYRTKIKGAESSDEGIVYWSFRGETEVKLHESQKIVKILEEKLKTSEEQKNEETATFQQKIDNLKKIVKKKDKEIKFLKQKKEVSSKSTYTEDLIVEKKKKKQKNILYMEPTPVQKRKQNRNKFERINSLPVSNFKPTKPVKLCFKNLFSRKNLEKNFSSTKKNDSEELQVFKKPVLKKKSTETEILDLMKRLDNEEKEIQNLLIKII